jgi:hypothetical protein
MIKWILLNIFGENPQTVSRLSRGERYAFGVSLLFGLAVLYIPLIYGIYLVWNSKW